MDRRRAFAALLLAFAALAARDAGPPPIREALWTVPQRRLEALTSASPECLTLPVDRDQRKRVALGRAAFHSPLLLGGQAARVGLSCASCHKNGRGNPDFHFPGLTGAAGTADVTSSLMSRMRGDGSFNPKPIPDLALDAPKVSRDPASPALRTFLRGLIVEEFDGAEPPPRLLDGLVAYVHALGPTGCAGKGRQPSTVAVEIGNIVLEAGALRQVLADGDAESALVVSGGIRDRLGQIAARYPGLNRDVKRLEALDRHLARVSSGEAKEPAQAIAALDLWMKDFARSAPRLMADEPQSLYNRDRLTLWLKGSAPI